MIQCGVVLNELVTNAIMHAFSPSLRRKGKIEILLKFAEGNMIELVVKDNGVGLPQNLHFQKTDSLGFTEVNVLVKEQLSICRNFHR